MMNFSRCLVASLFVFLAMVARLHATDQPESLGKKLPSAPVTKPISFAVLEDYDKGTDLHFVAKDFELMNELGSDQMRCSFGWDDYEPHRGVYDFAWLEHFVALAHAYGIKLRPYIAYTAPWAGRRGTDGIYWNDPPDNERDWYNFVFSLTNALRDYPNVLSYEFYNEENDSLWWESGPGQYGKALRLAALAVHAANPGAQVLLGGLVFPDYDWQLALDDSGYAPFYDILPFHAYPETWERTTVENYLDVQYYNYFVPEDRRVGSKPIWVNEMGFATTRGKTELDQANWFARALSTFLATPEIEELGIFELRDLAPGKDSIGGEPNYHLGLTYKDRRKKLAFSTVEMLVKLLSGAALTTADSEFTLSVTSGTQGELYSHLFQRPDGRQILFVYDKTSSPIVQVRLARAGAKAFRFAIDGTSQLYADFDGKTLGQIALTPGNVSIFRIDP